MQSLEPIGESLIKHSLSTVVKSTLIRFEAVIHRKDIVIKSLIKETEKKDKLLRSQEKEIITLKERLRKEKEKNKKLVGSVSSFMNDLDDLGG